MGNSFACFSSHSQVTKSSKRSPPFPNSRSASTKKKGQKLRDDDLLLQQQSYADALLFREHQRAGNFPATGLNRSASVVYPTPPAKKQSLPKSSSSRQRSGSDAVVQPHQLVNSQVNRIGYYFTLILSSPTVCLFE